MKGALLFLLTIVLFLPFGHSQARYSIDSLEMALEFTEAPKERINILLNIAGQLLKQHPNQALPYAEQAKELSQSENSNLLLAQSCNTLAEIHINLSGYKNAMDCAVSAKQAAKSVSSNYELERALCNIGIIYNDLGVHKKSSESFFECLKHSEQNKDKIMSAKALNGIGVVYFQQHNYDKALEYYFKAMNIAKEIQDHHGIGKGLNNIAAIYGIRGAKEKCRQYLHEALDVNLARNDMDMVGVNYLNLGYYYQELGNYDSAFMYFSKSLKIYEDLGKTASIISAKLYLVEYYLEVGELEKGLEVALGLLDEVKEQGLKRYMYRTSALLNLIYLKQGDTLKAMQFEVLQLKMKDSLNIEEKQTELSKLEQQYAFNKTEQKLRIQQQRKDSIALIIVITLIFIIVIVVLLWSRTRIKSRAVLLEKEKLAMDLELRSKELTSNAMSIMKKNEVLSRLAVRMKNIQKKAVKDETKQAIRKITIELNKAVEDETWEEFDLRFKQVHNEFFEKLNQKFPTLSPNEQRLCAFLRLNMTTKEISEITGQRTNTIEIARTRLRKKLGITNTHTNLIAFLTQI